MNQSVIKALQLLELFTEESPELTLSEISTMAAIPKPTAYRLLTTLETRNYLEKIKVGSHDSRYRLGLKLLELGQLVADQLEIRKIALPFMKELAEKINEVIHLVVVRQNEAVYIEKVESTRALRLYTKIGKSSPLYIGSGPKLLLAYQPLAVQQQILQQPNLVHLKSGIPINPDALLKELEHIREIGYSFSVGEQDENTTGISYPVYNFENKVVASLTVSGLSSYFEGDNLQNIKNETKSTAKIISEKLGYHHKDIVAERG